MAGGRNEAIFDALRDHLGTFCSEQGYRLALEGYDFPGEGRDLPDLYLAASFLPNRTNTRTHDSAPQHKRGIFQVSVVFKVNTGTLQGYAVADKIVGHFAQNTILWNGAVKVGIYSQPWSTAPTTDGSFYTLPVTIQYECGN